MPTINRHTRKQRFKRATAPAKPPVVSAAVSIPEPLYLSALSVADRVAEGNFSRYVRGLINNDLKKAS